MPRCCVFCQAEGNLTREHVIADWIGELFPFPILGHSEILRADGSLHRFPSKPLEQEVRAVCGTCNNNWMSDLENGVKSFLGPMLKDWKPTRLIPSRQRLLATWAVKTAFMFDQVHRSEQTVPAAEYHRFYAHKQPPETYVVWVAWRNNIFNNDRTAVEMVQSRQEAIRYAHCPDKASEYALRKQLDNGAALYRITFGIGHVAFQVFGTDIAGITLNNYGNVNIAHVIWPVRSRVTWPPRHPIDDVGGIDNFHNSFNPDKQTP